MDQNTVNDANGELYNWSDFDWDDEMGNAGQWEDLNFESEHQRITQLQSSVDLSPSAKEDLEALQRKLGTVAGKNGEAELAVLREVDAALDEMEHPTPESQKALDVQMKDYLSEHDKDLDKAETAQIEKWVAAYELDPEGTKKLISKEFKDLQTNVATGQVYGSKIEQLAKYTGMSPAKILEVFQKHGITDTEKLTDKQIQLVLPELGGERLAKATKALSKAQNELQSAWDKAAKQAEKVNSANRTNDEDKASNDFSAFKTLSDISNHSHPKSKAFEDCLREVAKASAPILAALKGVPEDQVKVLSGSPKLSEQQRASYEEMNSGTSLLGFEIPIPEYDSSRTLNGMLSINGESFNVIGNPRTGEIDISDRSNRWPTLDSVKVTVSDYTQLPDWMIEEGYPREDHRNEGDFSIVPFLFF